MTATADGVTLHGRDEELSTLQAALETALQGRGRLALVTGEPGIGKSALAAFVASEAVKRGAVVTWGRAWEYADAPPYFPVRACLRALGIDPDREKGSGSEAVAFHLWEDVLEALGRVSHGRARVWILEDLHASDLLTLDLLTFLAQPIRSTPLLVVATSRAQDPRLTERMTQRLTRMARDGLDVRLEPLGPLDVAAIAEQRVGRAVPAAIVRRLVEVTRGNPLFVVECARAFAASADVAARGRPAAGGAFGGGAAELPPTVRQVVLERVALLDEGTRDALACGAVLGRDFAAATVARMRGVLPARVIDALLPALRAGIVSEARPGHFVFSHTLVCEAIEDALAASERCELHTRAADALASLGDGAEILVERARHGLLSFAPDGEAFVLAKRAAELLEAQGGFDRAYALYERIEDARRAVGAPSATPSERLHVARIAEAAGRHADCRRICDEVIAAARATKDAEMLGRAALLVGKALRPGIVDRSLVALLEEARAMLGNASPSLDSRLLARLAGALQPAFDLNEPVQMARDAIAKARAIGDDAVLLEVFETAGAALVDCAPIDERIAAAAELLERATRAGDRPRALRAYQRLAFDHLYRGDIDAFGRDVDSMVALSDELGHPRYRWRVLLIASLRAVTLGQFAESDRCVVEVGQLATLTDDPGLPLALGAHELLRARIQRRDKDARVHAESVVSLLDGMPYAESFRALIRASVFARMDDEPATRAEIARIGAAGHAYLEADQTGRDWAAEAYAVGGTDEQRRRIRDALLPVVDGESIGSHVSYTYDGPTAFYLGRVEASLGADARAEELLRGALERVTARGHRPWIAQISYELGKLMSKLERVDEARRFFSSALVISDDLPMPGLSDALRERLAVSHETSPAPPRDMTSTDTRVPISLVREGDVWRVEQGTKSVRVRDSRGMHLLARLVERPDEEIHVLVLASDEGALAVGETSAGEHLDERARREYKARLADLDDDIAEAERNADAGRLERLRREADALKRELVRAVGLGGKTRQAGSSTERARVNVQRRIKDALARIAEADGGLGGALERGVRTGTFCCYRP